ncbi:MAG: hypothetical protein L6306_07865 [Planctomycetales bacterium]|nr:hypothetical protein [Planctomycetales bacterium]
MIQVPATQDVDVKRYEDVFARALSDVTAVLGASQAVAGGALSGPEDVYKEFCHTDPRMPSAWFGGHKIRELVSRICQNLGFKVRFLRWKPGQTVDLDGYVSWLTASFGEHELVVTYDPENIVKLYPEEATINDGGAVYARDKTLSKVFLHECGHAALHLNEFRQRRTPQEPNPSLDPEHEQEAWLYASVIWGVLTGDHSYAGRNRGVPDEGFVLV